MIRYLRQSEIDYKKWDDCISNSINGIVYAYSWYLDIVANKWDALVEDDYVAVMPLPYKKKYFIYKVYQPFFSQQLGVFSGEIISDKIIHNFLSCIPSKFLFVDINLNSMNPFKNKTSYIVEKRRTYLLDLIQSYDDLKKNFSENNRRNIKKSGKYNLFIKENDSFKEIIEVFKNNRAHKFPEIKNHHFKTLNRLLYNLIDKGLCQVVKVYDEHNTFSAGALFVVSGNRLIFMFSGASKESRTNGAMFFLIDYIIRKYQNTHTILDFEGSMDENLARFYRGFGSKECLYLRIKKKQLNFFN